MRNIIFGLSVLVLVVLGGILLLQPKDEASVVSPSPSPIATQEEASTSAVIKKMTKPSLTIDSSKKYTATLSTEAGDIVVDLFADKTPKTVNNFVYLSSEGFYNGTIFHRVIDGFMIQGGDPDGNGTGGPGYTIEDEDFSGEYVRGAVAMARTSLPNSAGSQFFIMHKDYPLPKDYVIFGQVTLGLEVVDAIASAEVSASMGGEKSKPVKPVKVLSVNVATK